MSDLWMAPEQVGEMVVKAIKNNELYIITHGEWRAAMKARYEAIMAATPKETNPHLIETLRNPKRRMAE
jgi:hypothetical protein